MTTSLAPREKPVRPQLVDSGGSPFPERVRRTNPESTRGGPGFTVYGGYLTDRERKSDLSGRERFRTFGQILADVPMVAAGVRYFLNLGAKTEWKIIPAEETERTEEAEELAKFVDKMFKTMVTPFHKVARHALMHRFYGFTTMEWTADRDEEGRYKISHIENRPQWTIERWKTDAVGRIHAISQCIPQTNHETTIPRAKLLYLADNSFTDDPRGLGILRHIKRSVDMLRDYEHLEQIGFETDMRGIPIARGPLAEIDANTELTQEDKDALKQPLIDFVTNHIRGADSGLVFDSSVYSGRGEDETPINSPKYDVELLSGGSYGHKEIAMAIERVNREIARVLGVEQLLLGADSAGSLALSRDKSQAFFMVVNSALTELQSAITQDILQPIWQLNLWDEELMPKFEFESVEFKDPEQISGAIKDLATSGVAIIPEDPAVDELLRVVGLSGINRQAREEQKQERLANAKLGLDENGLPLPGGNPFQQQAAGGSGGEGKSPSELSGNLQGVDPGGSADDQLRARQGRDAARRNKPSPAKAPQPRT